MARRITYSCDESNIDHWLHVGDQLKQPEFHRFYSAMPDGYRAELVGGLVFEPSPLSLEHSDLHSHLGSAFLAYAGPTKGLQAGDNASVFLSDEDEVQPDAFLRILPGFGGQSRDVIISRTKAKDFGVRYIEGAPELLAEVAHSSVAIDLHLKKRRYALAGVLEYVVICLEPQRIFWFNLPKQTELSVGDDGIFRSIVFPGLWINKDALLQCDYTALISTVTSGMQTAEYKKFSKKLVNSQI